MRNQATFEAQAEEPADGFPALVAVIQSPVVHVHADEFVGQVPAHVARVLEGVLHGFGAVVQAELDAGGEYVRNLLPGGGFETFMNDIAAQREGQAVILAPPPDPEVFANLQTLLLPSELAFVNDQANIRGT